MHNEDSWNYRCGETREDDDGAGEVELTTDRREDGIETKCW